MKSLMLTIAAMAACGGSSTNEVPASRVAMLDGFLRPESMRYDPDQDVWYVSNINGGTERDNNGFVSRVTGEGTLENRRFIAGGEKGVTLHGPKGMVMVGDTLWMTDLDAVRAFHRRTGAPIATVDLSPLGAVFLNDITIGPDGALYLTDSGVRFDSAGQRQHPGPDRIFRIQDRKPTIALESRALGQPNGITYDSKGKRFLLAPIVGDSAVQEWSPGQQGLRPVASGPGRYDGIEVTPEGTVLVSAWNDSTVNAVRDGRLVPLIRGVPSPADIGYDPRRRRVGVPLIADGRIEIYELGGR
jgi:sugar lactone lactonase YvrE